MSELESFVQRVRALDQSAEHRRFFRVLETLRLLRWSRRSIRRIESALERAVRRRTQLLESLGQSATESPNDFLITGVFNFKDAISELDEKRSVLAGQTSETSAQLEHEKTILYSKLRMLRARLSGLRAADASLRKDAPKDEDTPDPLESERRDIEAKLRSVEAQFSHLKEEGEKAISDLESQLTTQEERMGTLENRASAIRRDLGRALVENESSEEARPVVTTAKEAADAVEKLLEFRKNWLRETQRIDRKPLFDVLMFLVIVFGGLSVFFAFT